MAKRQLTAGEMFELRQALHVAVLDALMASRRWQPGDLIFQGGTGLHLAHGSPRYSEDLGFLVNASLKLTAIEGAVQNRLAATSWLPTDMHLVVGKSKDGHNPHAFVVSITGPAVIGAVRVKVELWQTDAIAMSSVKVIVAPVRLARGPAAGMQVFVPTAEAAEIYSDKVFALGARPYLKPRDVFDLHWLTTHENVRQCSADDFRVRLATYPNETPAAWLAKSETRLKELRRSVPAITIDLKRWLPSTWPLDESSARAMVDTSATALEQGIELMQEISDEYDDDSARPRP